MLDQSFSADNFRKILDYENRKGIYLEELFFQPDVVHLSAEIKECNDQYKIIKSQKENLGIDEFNIRRKAINNKKTEIKTKKDNLIYDELKKFSEIASKKEFNFSLLKKSDPIFHKPIYAVENKPEYYFAMKQIQNNFRYIYKVKQANRYSVVSQIKTLLGDGFPKIVVRTDIKNFYESIPHNSFLKKLNEDSLLSFQTRQLLYKLLKGYEKISGVEGKGIPRGIGISAYLAEFFMRGIDAEIRQMDDVYYYARYVDDIIVMFTPCNDGSFPDYISNIQQIIQSDQHNLTLNLTKSKFFDLREPQQTSRKLEYLGYEITFLKDSRDVSVGMTRRKVIKYCHRINVAFYNYHKERKVHEKRARKMLLKRLRYLTSNTRLKSRKQHVIIGIFYSNSLIDDMAGVETIDKFLKSKILRNKLAPAFRNRLLKFSFKRGFEGRTFSPFKTNELSKLVNIWRYPIAYEGKKKTHTL